MKLQGEIKAAKVIKKQKNNNCKVHIIRLNKAGEIKKRKKSKKIFGKAKRRLFLPSVSAG